MNPYEADPLKIPQTDRFADVPFYGRYSPHPNNFKPDPRYINCTSPESIKYWASILDQCDASIRIYENTDGGRDVFALGGVIIKSSHLKACLEGRRANRDYSYADANEVEAITLAREPLGDVRVPRIYFAGKVNDRDVLVQERIAGVGLNIAWQYISQAQKMSFKQQARAILRKLHAIKPSSSCKHRSYVVPYPDPIDHRGIQVLERDIIFSANDTDQDLGLMHNDVSVSNCIVDNDRSVGLVDWEMAGYFGWKTAGEVHLKIRTPKKEMFAALNLSPERLQDILFWNDLYSDDPVPDSRKL